MIVSNFSTPFFHFFQIGGLLLHTVGIICEYNPLHSGHKKQLDWIRAENGSDCAIVCLMSGNFVQRGHPAIFDKTLRAQAAIACGGDLVLEMPVTAVLSSAEGFAAGGVEILSMLCDSLCFGAENPDAAVLSEIAAALLSPAFSEKLRPYLERGLSFPAARQSALEEMRLPASLLMHPNNILAVEYCKAILAQYSPMVPMPILRQGNYHDTEVDKENPSATALRSRIATGGCWLDYVPMQAQPVVAGAAVHQLCWGEKAMLGRLRTMTEAEFEALPYGSEGLWRKFMHACRRQAAVEEIIASTKSKRYTRTRLDRMAMCAFLGLKEADFAAPIPYVRVLAFNERGRKILGKVRNTGFFVNLGQDTRHPYQALEQRCGRLYGLFAKEPESPDSEEKCRVFYQKEEGAPCG